MKHINILLPTDFSELSWKAMCYAANLYHHRVCSFFLINTTNIPFHQLESNVMTKEIKVDENTIEKMLLSFKDLDHHPSSMFKMVAHVGTINGSINNLLDAFNEDNENYIVMSTKGANDLSDFLFGTVTSNIAKHVHIPTYCIPENTVLENPKNIMLAVDNKILKEIEILSIVSELAESINSHVHVVNVSNHPDLFNDDSPEKFVIDQYLDGIKHSFSTIKGSYVQDELINYSECHSIDLIIMLKKKKGFWQSIFEPSNTENMSLYGNKPLLILKEEEEVK